MFFRHAEAADLSAHADAADVSPDAKASGGFRLSPE
jgi:hypothetical protein